MGKWLWPALAGLGILWGTWQSHGAAIARQRAGAAALAHSNEVAAHDSTRLLFSDLEARSAALERLLGDSLRVVQRLAIQRRARADSLDRELRLERVATAGLVGTIRELRAVIASAPVAEDSSGTRVGVFDYREVPYTVHARASLPRVGPGALEARIRLDPLGLQLRLGCGPADRDGIRPASATVIAPAWAAIALEGVEQSSHVCPSPALVTPAPSRLKWAAIGAGAFAAIREAIRILFNR